MHIQHPKKVEEGKYYLEDHTAQVPLNFSQASLLTDGFVTENSIVLVEGEAIDGVLHVHNIGEYKRLEWCNGPRHLSNLC